MPTLHEIRHKPNFTPQANRLALLMGIDFDYALEVMNLCTNLEVAIEYIKLPESSTRYQQALEIVVSRIEEVEVEEVEW